MAGPAAARWHTLVSDRLEEMRRLRPQAGSLSGSFWDEGRAERYAKHMLRSDPEKDPLLRRLRAVTDASSSVLDVGAGTGRHALALAPHVAHVTAVDPSGAMLGVLRRDAQERGQTNVDAVEATWADADVAPADVAFSSFVMPLIADGAGFLAKLEAAARERVLLYLASYTGDAVVEPLWRRFHDGPRLPGATYLDAIDVLRELGVEPRVQLVEIPNRRRFETIDEAVGHYVDWLLLEDTEEVREQLADLLRHWLLGRRGALRSPLRTMPAAIIEWRPRAA